MDDGKGEDCDICPVWRHTIGKNWTNLYNNYEILLILVSILPFLMSALLILASLRDGTKEVLVVAFGCTDPHCHDKMTGKFYQYVQSYEMTKG